MISLDAYYSGRRLGPPSLPRHDARLGQGTRLLLRCQPRQWQGWCVRTAYKLLLNIYSQFDDLETNPQVNISFSDPSSTNWVSAAGKASILKDAARWVPPTLCTL